MTIIRFSGLELDFLQDRVDTGGSLDLFTMVVQSNANMPVAHYHETWDETVYSLCGTTTWRIAGRDVALEAGRSIFIPRGTVHGFRNDTNTPTKCLVVLTPGALSTEYFEEIANLANSGVRDLEAMKAVMSRYGLVPSPNPEVGI
jgi:quercetin dioxygenase-like cupin family protein